MAYEGLLDWLGRECRALVNLRGNKWKFAGLQVAGLEEIDVDIGGIGGESKNLQKISDTILALDNLQFRDCERRKKWHERLAEETDPLIRLEITRALLESEEKTYAYIVEIVKLLRGLRSALSSTKEANTLESKLEEIALGL